MIKKELLLFQSERAWETEKCECLRPLNNKLKRVEKKFVSRIFHPLIIFSLYTAPKKQST